MQNFFGRDSEIELLKKWNQPGEIIVLSGPPGVGKSTICKRLWGEEVIWLDAQFWIGDVVQALYSALNSSLGLFWKGETQFVLDYLKDLDDVVVIDNAEYVDESKLRDELKTIRNNCTWVMTTRRSLDVAEFPEIRNLKVGALGSDQSNEAAKKLFSAHSGGRVPDEILEKLLTQLDYHPMSIKLCATMTRWAGESYILDLIQKKEGGSIAPELWPLARLENVFMDLWTRLGDETKFFLERISQMTMPIPIQDLLVLFGQFLDFDAVMEEATGYGLVEIIPHRSGNRLQMTQALRVFCGEQFGTENEKISQWSNALLDFFFKKHDSIWNHWECLSDDRAIESVRKDRLILTRLLRSKRTFFTPAQTIELGLLVCVSNLANETMFEVIDLLREIDAFPEDHSWPSAHLNCEILLHELTSELDQKTIDRLEILDKAINTSVEKASIVLQWKIATQLVWVKCLRNEIVDAKLIISQMFDRANALEKKGVRIPGWVIARFEMRVSSLYHMSGETDKAVQHYKKTTTIARQANDTRSLIMASNNLGVLYSDQCQLGLSRQCLDEAKNSRFLGSSFRSMNQLSSGLLYLRAGNTTLARQTFLDAGALMARTQQRSALSLIELNLCMVALDEEDVPLARLHLRRVQQSERENDPMLDLSIYLMECVALVYEGAVNEAFKLSEKKRQVSVDSNLTALAICFYTTTMVCFIVDDKLEQAAKYLEEARSMIDTSEIHLILILEQVELFILMKRSRTGKIKTQQIAFLKWLKRERDIATGRRTLKSESVRTVQYTMRKTLIGREVGFWTLFNRWNADTWHGYWIVDENSGIVCSPDGKWIDLSRNQQLVTILKTLVFHDTDGVISLDNFAETLWPDQVLHPESINNRIHVALSKLRSLGCQAWIERHNEGYRLDVVQKSIWIDGNRVYRSGVETLLGEY